MQGTNKLLGVRLAFLLFFNFLRLRGLMSQYLNLDLDHDLNLAFLPFSIWEQNQVNKTPQIFLVQLHLAYVF
jgi:hypothetical protein